ncbi:MAG TPA: BTAD domain-containing putative transcriptional regulator, partial [Alphaproteobacteria bacterium]|nr:BTAD domain-containing putative transcriptional regulator [Alphaproteobacteria bacterium]
MTLDITLLGGFAAKADGAPLALPTRKAEALLAFLALKPGVARRRERIAATLWPRSGEAQARGSLRQTLTTIRKALQPAGVAGIISDGDTLHLDPEGVSVDAARLDAALADGSAAELARAAELYAGDLLDGFALNEEPFEDWLGAERTRIRENALEAMRRLLDRHAGAGETAQGLALGERLLALDPTVEAAHRAMMRLHAAAGGRSAVVKQYRRCRDVLAQELQVEPEAATETLYRELVGEGAAVASATVAKSASAGAKPAIAVLPFANLSGDEAQGYFAQGLAEDIITQLSRFSSLDVIARNSSFAFAGKDAPITKIANDLSVGYLLEGSVRSAGETLRVTAQLVDGVSERQLWADRYDVGRAQLFEVQDDITAHVVGALAIKIDDAVLERARHAPDESLQAYDFWLRGHELLHRGTVEADDEARALFEQALKIDPHYARAYVGLSLSHFNEWSCQAWDKWEEKETAAYETARRAIELDDNDPMAHAILGKILLYRRQYGEAERHMQRALALNPNDTEVMALIGLSYAYIDQAEKGVALCKNAIRLNPFHPEWYVGSLAFALFFARRLDEAIEIGAAAPVAYVDQPALMASG